jgi:hypothetical protein
VCFGKFEAEKTIKTKEFMGAASQRRKSQSATNTGFARAFTC